MPASFFAVRVSRMRCSTKWCIADPGSCQPQLWSCEDPGSAAHHCVLRCARETLVRSLRRCAVGGQHFTGQIKRAGDQDTRRGMQVELAGEVKRALEVVA